MERINREAFLQRLQSVAPGLSKKADDTVQQSSAFAFKDGYVYTFNDEVFCRHKSGLSKKTTGAVKAAPLLNLLQKLKEEELDLEFQESELFLGGQRKKDWVTAEQEITLSIDFVEQPAEWAPLHAEFSEMLNMAVDCSSRGQHVTRFNITCVHFHPRYIEGFDNVQMVRCRIKTGVREEVLVKRDGMKALAQLGVTEMSETDSWLHFKNPSGLIVSCRRYLDSYPELHSFFEERQSSKAMLPKSLIDDLELASIFSADNTEGDYVEVLLKPGRIRVKSRGLSGRHLGWEDMPSYKGQPMKFFTTPRLLSELVKKSSEVQVAEGQIRMNGERYTYIMCLGDLDEEDE